MPSARPNILWVSFEDTNPFYGCYGDPVAKTPNLDRLAAQGCIYSNAFAVAGVCAPARSAVITSMYPTSVGTMHMRTTHANRATPEMPTPYSACVPHYVKCFSEYLRAAGYYCSNNEKADYQFTPPRTAWDDCSNCGHWRNRPDKEQPFFAVFNLQETHESGMWDSNDVAITVDPDAILLPPDFPDPPTGRLSMARMYSHIENNDRKLGELLRQLEEDGLADNTIVMHWSDHGPLPRGKRWPYDSGIHVPMIVRWPGYIEPGTRNDRLVSTIDLGPTVMSMIGLSVPVHMQGQAFLGDQATQEREYIFASRDRYDESYDMIRAARDKRFKYIRHYRPDLPYLLWIPYRNRHPILQEMWRLHLEGKLEGAQTVMFRPRPVEELYDTESDPFEVRNLAKYPAFDDTLARLRAAVDTWIEDVGDMGQIPEVEMVRQWYPNMEQPTTAAPLFVPITSTIHGQNASEGERFQGPVLLQLHCATQGASIAYTLDDGDNPCWSLYTVPIRLEAGAYTVRARAIRIGYLESREAQAAFGIS